MAGLLYIDVKFVDTHFTYELCVFLPFTNQNKRNEILNCQKLAKDAAHGIGYFIHSVQ